MKKLIAGLLLVLLILSLACTSVSAAVPRPSSQVYVTDLAGVLSDEQERSMSAATEALSKQAEGAQVVVLTVTDLDGQDPGQYATDIAREWGIGSKQKDNGVLILLSTGDRAIEIAVGEGLEGCLPDGKTGRLIDDYAIPYYDQNDFATGTEQLFHAVMNVVCEEYGVDPASLNVPVMDTAEEEITTFDLIFLLVAIAGMVALVVLTRGRVLIFFGFGGFGRGGRGGGGGGRSFGGGSFGGGGAGRRF